MSRIRIALAPCLGLVLNGALSFAAPPKQDALTAPKIIARMEESYYAAKTYQDTGEVNTTYIKSGDRRTETLKFRTAFVRPDKLRFEYNDHANDARGKPARYIIWRDKTEVRTWWDVEPGVKNEKHLSEALYAAKGVSGRSSQTVPGLLLPTEAGGARATDIKSPKRLEDAATGGADCYRVRGMYRDSPTTLWIDKKTFLLRRLDVQTQFKDFRTEETTNYEPVAGADVPEKLLEFDAPAAR